MLVCIMYICVIKISQIFYFTHLLQFLIEGMNSKIVSHSIHFLIAIMSYGRFASKCTCYIPFDPSLRGRAVQVLDVRLKIGIIGSSSPFSNTFYWRVS